MEQGVLRERYGTNEKIPSVSEAWRVQGSTTKHQNLIDYTKGFDSVQHLKMWNIIRGVGISKHLTVLIGDQQRQRLGKD